MKEDFYVVKNPRFDTQRALHTPFSRYAVFFLLSNNTEDLEKS